MRPGWIGASWFAPYAAITTKPPVACTVTGIKPCQRITGFVGFASAGITGIVSTTLPSTTTSIASTSIHVAAWIVTSTVIGEPAPVTVSPGPAVPSFAVT